jgi:hypothetical protein
VKVVIPSRGHLPRVKAHEWLDNLDVEWVFVAGTWEEADRLLQIAPIERVVCCERPELGIRNISWVRDWIFNEFLPRDEWAMTVDDNVSHLSMLPEPWYHDGVDDPGDFREEFDEPVNAWTFRVLIDETIERAEEQGTIMCGFSTYKNHFFRKVKWKSKGLCRTSAALYKSDGSPWRMWPEQMIDDVVKSFDVLDRYGSVVINHYAKANKTEWQEGGIGSLEERIPYLTDDCTEILARWPHLARPHKPHDVRFR